MTFLKSLIIIDSGAKTITGEGESFESFDDLGLRHMDIIHRIECETEKQTIGLNWQNCRNIQLFLHSCRRKSVIFNVG